MALMNMMTALMLIERVELRVATLYKIWAARFEADTEASFLFYRLHLEETGHAQLAKHCQKVVAKERRQKMKVQISVDADVLDQIDAVGGNAYTVKEAMSAALHIEAVLGELYLKSDLSDLGDEFVKKSIEYLGEIGHSDSIVAFMTTHGMKE